MGHGGLSLTVVLVVYVVVGIAVPPMVSYFCKSQYSWIDVVSASVVAALIAQVPTVGGTVSLLVMGALLYWRTKPPVVPDIVVAVGGSRLVMVGVFLLLRQPT